MREYKFRAWDSWWDKMYYFDFAKNIKATPDNELKGLWILHEEGSVYAIQDKIKIMQYTGLKDKNGLEIYEGDIVIPQTFTNAKYRVYWSQERLQWSIISTSNVPKESGRALINNSTLYEVIGNIYENPELLTEKESEVLTWED